MDKRKEPTKENIKQNDLIKILNRFNKEFNQNMVEPDEVINAIITRDFWEWF